MQGKEQRNEGPKFQFRPGGGGPGAILSNTPVKLKNAKGTLRRLLAYLAGQRRVLALIFFFSLLATVINIMGARMNGHVIDHYIAKKDPTGLLVVCIFLLAVYLVSVAAAYFQNFLMIDAAQKTTAEIRKDLFASFQRLPLSFFDRRSSGDLMSRLTNDVDNINATLSQNVTHLFSGVINIVGMLIAMLLLSPRLTLISMVTIPVIFLSTRGIAKLTKRYFKRQQRNLGELNGFVEEIISGQKIVKIFGREEEIKKEFNHINTQLKKTSVVAQAISGAMGPLMNFINNITYLVVAVAGGSMVLTNEGVTVGVVFTFLLYMRNFSRPLNEIANLLNVIQSALAGAERVFEIIDEKREEDAPDAEDIDAVQGNIRFEDVTFSYIRGKEVLKEASITVEQGQQIAIVGPTGAGKTTIISLLTRFYDIDDGQIVIDGKDIQRITRKSLRRKVGMVLQDTYLFSESVADNIRYGRLDATDEEVIRAAQLANAHAFIMHMAQGYDTVLSDNASNISQGQRQLIAIARAILADPQILILDEATSSIDTRTELKIQEALQVLMKGRTSFIIAHRLSTIKNADCILVIEQGRVAESGTHGELLQKDGVYANLYNSQFKTGMAL